MEICITGISGTVGRNVAQQLRAAAIPFRGAFFSPDKAAAARDEGVDAVCFDYRDEASLRAAFTGCRKLFLLGPHALEQTAYELRAVAAAQAVGVEHVVKLSVMGAEAEDFSLARVHRPVERALSASAMRWTFVRPNSFMQNVETYMGATLRAESTFYSASGEGRISHVDVRDVAAVVVRALLDARHENRAYTLTGPRAWTYDELASTLSDTLGRPIRHVNLPPEALDAAMRESGMPEPLVDRMLDLERYYREGRAATVTDDVRLVTGVPARRFPVYLTEAAAALRPETA